MPRHPYQDAITPVVGNASADAISQAVETFTPLVVQSASEITTRSLDRTKVVHLQSGAGYRIYRYDPYSTGAEDGTNIILDAEERPFVFVGSVDGGGGFDAYDTTANQDYYDDETEGFRLFLVDAFDGDGGWVVRDDAGVGGWFGPFPHRGPRGGDRYDLFFDDPDQPVSGEVVLKAPFTTEVTFPAGMLQSKARADTGPAAEAVFSLRKNGVEFATCTFAIGATTGTFACPSATTFDPDNNDELSIVAPDPMDATLRRPRLTLSGFRPTT